jgi:hypothetical protein
MRTIPSLSPLDVEIPTRLDSFRLNARLIRTELLLKVAHRIRVAPLMGSLVRRVAHQADAIGRSRQKKLYR